MSTNTKNSSHPKLRRTLKTSDAVLLGLGSIVGTGVYVSIGLAASISGSLIIISILLAAFVALCNAMSSAQLAANHPVSGGTYEYGYRYLHPLFGLLAGWLFLLAKSASAASAALGIAAYLINWASLDSQTLIPIAIAVIVILTTILLMEVRVSSRINAGLVLLTFAALLVFILASAPKIAETFSTLHLTLLSSWQDIELPSLFHATALLFVAYTGYGRIATLGEEIESPRTTIPKAIVLTLIYSTLLYVLIGLSVIPSLSTLRLAQETDGNYAALEVIAESYSIRGLTFVVTLGAVTAMFAVLFNLILGLSRVSLAMARRSDLPQGLSRLNRAKTTPFLSVLAVGVTLSGLCLIGDIRTTWSISAVNVLLYYGITNLAALQLSKEERLYNRFFPCCGLVSCIFLAFWIDLEIWILTASALTVALLLSFLCRKLPTSAS